MIPVIAVFVFSGCPEPEFEPAADCTTQIPGDIGVLPQRELHLGELVDGVFTPWTEGQQVSVVYGFQGSPMLTPWFELPANANDEDRECWHLLYQHLDANGEHDPSHEAGKDQRGLVFSLDGEVMQAGPLFDIVDAGDGETVRLRATLIGSDFVAIEELSIVLVY